MIRSILLLENKSDNHSSSVKSIFYKWKDYDVKSRSDLVQAGEPAQCFPRAMGAGQSGAYQTWEMFLFSRQKAQKNKSSQEKKKGGGDSLPREILSQSSPCH